MPRIDPTLKKSIIEGYIQAAYWDVVLEEKRRAEEARRPKPITLTVGPVATNSNGTFQITSVSSTTVSFPPFYGGTLDPETGRLYDARKPPGERSVDPKELEKRRARSKAARKARRKGRRG